jgi:hypothetical protein
LSHSRFPGPISQLHHAGSAARQAQVSSGALPSSLNAVRTRTANTNPPLPGAMANRCEADQAPDGINIALPTRGSPRPKQVGTKSERYYMPRMSGEIGPRAEPEGLS